MKAKPIVNPVSEPDAPPDVLTLSIANSVKASARWTSSLRSPKAMPRRPPNRRYATATTISSSGVATATLNEVLNGVARLDQGLSQVTFGVIPLGTGNDFAAGSRSSCGHFADLPGYQQNILQKIMDVRGAGKGGAVEQVRKR